jgi:hypothetical protein
MAVILKAWGIEKGKWHLEITGEVWEFNDTKHMEEVLAKLVSYKNDFGRIDKRVNKFGHKVED